MTGICEHPRQWVPTVPGDSQRLPCAVPGCRNGNLGEGVKIMEPPRPGITSAATFFQDAVAHFESHVRTQIYMRAYRLEGGQRVWFWAGPADPFPSVTT